MESASRFPFLEFQGDLEGDVETWFVIGFLQTPLSGIQWQDVEHWPPWPKFPGRIVVLYLEDQL
jgi:hypothetical protein